MDEEYLRAIESRKYLDDQVALSQVQQLAFGKAVSTIVSTTVVPTAATNLYATSKAGVLSHKPYYKVDDAALFMDNKLKFQHLMFIQYVQMIQCMNLTTHNICHQIMQLLNTSMLCIITIY